MRTFFLLSLPLLSIFLISFTNSLLRNPAFNKALIVEVHRALNLKMDFTSETPNERLFRNPILQRSLSLQTSIYYEGEEAPMNLPAKLAWIFLHLRIASLGFGTTITALQRGEELKIGMSFLTYPHFW